jgi:hypothetical protein
MADRGSAAEARATEAATATCSPIPEAASSARHGPQDVLEVSLASWRASCAQSAKLGLEIVFCSHLRASSPIVIQLRSAIGFARASRRYLIAYRSVIWIISWRHAYSRGSTLTRCADNDRGDNGASPFILPS